jgi:tetratricopeptide (TPR) repeat protein
MTVVPQVCRGFRAGLAILAVAAVLGTPRPARSAPDSAPPAAVAPESAPADNPGQADLDAAIEAKLAANSLDDFGKVLTLCKQATEKGLDAESRKFADELYTGTLVDRAGMLVDVIYAADEPDPRWQQMRAFALRDLGEIIDRDPQLGQAHLMIARLESLPRGNRGRAREAAEKALELLDDDGLQKARAHVVLANLEEDEAARAGHFDAAVELAPRDADIRRQRGLFRLTEDEFAGAREDLAVALAEEPDDASLHEALGMACAMDDRVGEALEAFGKAIELAPESPGPLLQRGRLLAQEEKFDDALADIDRALELEPRSTAAQLLRARILQRSGDGDEARAVLETVLERDPDNAAALELRGLLAAERDDYPAAIRDFRRLASRNGDDAVVVGQLGMLYLAAKQPREAIRRFTRAIEIDADYFPARRGRSDALISIGDHRAALSDLERALTLQPEDSGVLNNLAWLLATSPDDGLRDSARAIELATKACELTDWKEAHIVSTLAAGYAEKGDFEAAKKYSRQAVETGGDAAGIQEQLAKELASYESGAPWRERQEMPEAALEEADAGAEPAAERPPAAPRREPRRPFDE